jgi:acyl-CoA hydrolase
VRHVNSCFFTMVAVGDDKKPASIPPLAPSTPDEVRRFEEAKGRRDARLALEKDHAQRISARG